MSIFMLLGVGEALTLKKCSRQKKKKNNNNNYSQVSFLYSLSKKEKEKKKEVIKFPLFYYLDYFPQMLGLRFLRMH